MEIRWDSLTLAAIEGWRFWVGLKNVWPAVAAAGVTCLRRVWRARDADGGGGAGTLPEE